MLVCGHGTTGCHGWFEHHPEAAHREGFHVRPWEQPAEVAVHWRKSRWVYLTKDGELVDV